jgi:predicted RNase H-like nuclease (RuvC/YqgF family)
MTQMPFDTSQFLTLLGMAVAAAVAWGEARITIKDQGRRIVELESKVDTLEAKAASTQLLEAAMRTVEKSVNSLEHEMRNNRRSMGALQIAMARLQAKLEMEQSV